MYFMLGFCGVSDDGLARILVQDRSNALHLEGTYNGADRKKTLGNRIETVEGWALSRMRMQNKLGQSRPPES